MPVVPYKVGAPWPHGAAEDGMQAVIDPAADSLSVMLVCHVAGLTPDERETLTRGPMRLGVLPSPPLTWLLLAGPAITLDAPYAVGIAGEEHRAHILRAAHATMAMRESQRLLVTIAVVDRGVVAVLRAASASRDLALTLAGAILATPAPLDRALYDAAIRRDARQSTAQMLAAAQAVETMGRA